MPSTECEEEFEILQSIYKEIVIEPDKPNGESLVSMLLFPATGDDTELRYVKLTLEFLLGRDYPESLPKIIFRNPRGLSEDQLEILLQDLVKSSQEMIGSPMLFQLIDTVKDFLTTNNRPASECPICLMSFTDFDVFYTPSCYHHFHSRCLGIHLQNIVDTYNETNEVKLSSEAIEKLCPVCRLGLDPAIDIDKLKAAPSPSPSEELIGEVEVPSEWVENRDKLKELYDKQKKQGGIINMKYVT